MQNYMNASCEKFISYARKFYSKLSEEEKDRLKYGDLVEATAIKYYEGDYDNSKKKSGYRFFQQYYYSHCLTKENEYAVNQGTKITLEDIVELLNYDFRQQLLLETLESGYRYYYFLQTVTNENNAKESRYVLIIECNTDAANNSYDVISKYFENIIDNMFFGYGGIALIFSEENDFKTFLGYIKK